MFKRIGFVLALIAALAMATSAFAQAPGEAPLPATTTRISFLPGTSTYTLTTNLIPGVSQGYVLGLSAQQVLYVLKSGDASVQILDPQGNALSTATTQPGPWGVGIHQTGDYTVVLLGEGSVTVSLYVPPLGVSAHPPVPMPLYSQRIRFAPGSTGYSFEEELAQGVPAGFVLGISAQQQLTVVAQGNLTAALLDAQGDALLPAMPVTGQWQYTIPETGDYTLVLLGSGTAFISVNIPPLAGPPPSRDAQRIIFAPGSVSDTITPNLLPGVEQAYLLGISRGQTLYISTVGGATFQVFDPWGNPVAYSVTPWSAFAYNIAQDGDYTVTVLGRGQTSITFYIPALPSWY